MSLTAASLGMEWRSFPELSSELLYELLRFRQAIFVVEQHSPYADLDGHDQGAFHLLLRVEGTLAGCLRLIPGKGEVAIGRVAVAPKWRRCGFAGLMMRESLARCRRDWSRNRVVLGAQAYLVPFYRGFGFATVSAPYDDAGVPHVDMALPPRDAP